MKLIIFLLTIASSVLSAPAVLYDHMKLVLTWPGTYCESDYYCRKEWVSSWNKKSFVVHGLWPSSNSNGGQTDDLCTIAYKFNDGDIPSKLKSKLNEIMPDLRYGKSGLWKHQFEKHGSCFAKLLKDKGSKTNDKDLMIQYFQTIVDLYNKIAPQIKLTKSSFQGSEDLASAFGVRANQMQISSYNGDIKQVRLCFSLPVGGRIGTQILTACPRYRPFKSNLALPQLALSSHHLHL